MRVRYFDLKKELLLLQSVLGIGISNSDGNSFSLNLQSDRDWNTTY